MSAGSSAAIASWAYRHVRNAQNRKLFEVVELEETVGVELIACVSSLVVESLEGYRNSNMCGYFFWHKDICFYFEAKNRLSIENAVTVKKNNLCI